MSPRQASATSCLVIYPSHYCCHKDGVSCPPQSQLYPHTVSVRSSPQDSDHSDWGVPLDSPPPATASSPQGPGDGARGCGASESDGCWGRVPLNSSGCALLLGGLCGVPGRGTQESGEGPGAAWDGESKPESSTFSGEEEEKGEGLDVKPRLLEPAGRGWGWGGELQTSPTQSPFQLPTGHAHVEERPAPIQSLCPTPSPL